MDGWGDGQMKNRMGGWKKRCMDRYLNVRMCDWMEGEIYFYNFPTSKKVQRSFKKRQDNSKLLKL